MSDCYRNLEFKIDYLLKMFPVVIILGIRQGGKTTIAKKVRPDWKYFDLERASDFDLITDDFDFFFRENQTNTIIDEAQLSPELFQELRGVIDSNRNKKNRFILTGSSSFSLLKNVSETLAGRVAIVELGTLKLNEYYQTPLSSFYDIFSNSASVDPVSHLKTIRNPIKHSDIISFFLRGGFPEPTLSDNQIFYDNWMENYFNLYVERDIRRLFPRLNIVRYRRFIQMLCSMSGKIINRSELGRSLDTSEVTVKEYLDIAHGSYLWRNISSYENSVSKSVLKMPRGNFRDSGLNHYYQRITDINKLHTYPSVGSDFEAFITEEIIKGLQATMVTGWNYYYYRTKNGAEVDLILEGNFGIIPVEIKYGVRTKPARIHSLKKFINDNNIPFGIVINNSEEVAMLSDRIIQIPAGFV